MRRFGRRGFGRRLVERFRKFIDPFDCRRRGSGSRGIRRDHCDDPGIVTAADAMQHHLPAVDRKFRAALVERVAAHGFGKIMESGQRAGGLARARKHAVARKGSDRSRDIFDQKLEGVAWRTKPSWYIVGANDRTVNPDLERAAAKRMGATTYEFETSHVPMVSRPDLVLGVVRDAAKAVRESLAIA